MTEPSAMPPRSHWRPSESRFWVCLLFLSHSAPGGGTLDGGNGALSMFLMVIGLLSTIVFFVTLIVALVQLLVD
jgi:hypothetical protein